MVTKSGVNNVKFMIRLLTNLENVIYSYKLSKYLSVIKKQSKIARKYIKREQFIG